MMDTVAEIGVDDLLKLVLLLAALLLAVRLVEAAFRLALGVLRPLLTLAIAVLIVLWLLDRL